MKYEISRAWDEVSLRFHQMFDGLGLVELNEQRAEFRSLPPAVSTGISLDRQGRLLANMPLHSIQSTFTTITFDEGMRFLLLEGPERSYTYTVPSELLALRGGLTLRGVGGIPTGLRREGGGGRRFPKFCDVRLVGFFSDFNVIDKAFRVDKDGVRDGLRLDLHG